MVIGRIGRQQEGNEPKGIEKLHRQTQIQKSPPANAPAFADGDFPFTTRSHCHVYRGSYEESSRVLPTGSFLLLFSFIFLCFAEVLLGIVVGFKKSFVTSLRFFAPSLLGTSSLRADVAASVGDNFFCVNLKKFVCKRAYKVHLGPLRPSLEESSCPKVVPPLAPPHGHGSNCLAAHPKKRAMSVECM